MDRYAIISVYKKDKLTDLAQALIKSGYKILSTGGSGQALEKAGIAYTSIEEYTGQKEIMDGRVKTLHPKVHAGLLARRDNSQDMQQLAEQAAGLIDFVIVNLYPFFDKVREVLEQGKQTGSLIESIDIGGPTMLRAAAKNCAHVVPVCDTDDYETIIAELEQSGKISLQTRRLLAAKVFALMSAYDGEIARYFSADEEILAENKAEKVLLEREFICLEKQQDLRYGENPHQQAALYVSPVLPACEWTQLQGKELSYNNILDTDAAIRLAHELVNADLKQVPVVIIKHTNPCGVALASSALEAFESARVCDPISAFGGIVAVAAEVDAGLASSIVEGFVEVVIAPNFSAEALVIFAKKKNVRLIAYNFAANALSSVRTNCEVKRVFAGYLMQTQDSESVNVSALSSVTAVQPKPEQIIDLTLAWLVCKHVKSNAIVIVKNGKAIGVGAGQMSRVDSAQLAIRRAQAHGHEITNAVAASDAFLPFSDTLEVLNDAGVCALVQPGGSIKDDEVIAAANARNMLMLLTGVRHFRH